MKFLLKFLLQVPLLYFMANGIESIIGGNYWITVLIGFAVLTLHSIGEELSNMDK